jgi:hypothetical protein
VWVFGDEAQAHTEPNSPETLENCVTSRPTDLDGKV